MIFKKLLLTTIAAATTLAVSADALDMASRTVLRQASLIERNAQEQANAGQRASLKSLSRGDAPTAAAAGIPALIQLAEGADVDEIAGEGVQVLGSRHGFVFATVTPEAALKLDINPAIQRIELNRRRDMKMDMVRAVTGVDAVHQGVDLKRAYTGKNVVCGIVDTGFDPNHPNFKDANGKSRYKYFAQVGVSAMGDIMVNKHDEASLARFTSDNRNTFHGAHTSGIMAGSYRGPLMMAEESEFPFTTNVERDCPYYGIAYNAELAASTGIEYDAFIAYALDGILEWKWNNRYLNPIVVNMSVGGNQGPHDGSSAICQFMDICAEQDGAIICVSAGNEADISLALNKTFAEDDLTIATGVEPFVYGQDAGNVRYGLIEIYSNDDQIFDMQAVIYNKARNRVICRMPVPNAVGQIQYWCSGAEYQEGDTDIVDSNFARAFAGYVGLARSVDQQTGRAYIVVDLYTQDNPTSNSDGNYVLGLEITGNPGQRINGYTDGRFIQFASLGIDGWSEGSADGTISDVACGKNTICVGSVDVRADYPAMDGVMYQYPNFTPGAYTFYSSYATMPDGSTLPHICAPGATVISSGSTPYVSFSENYMPEQMAQGKIPGDARDSYYLQMHGTSMATPVVAGIVALMLEAKPSLKFEDVRRILMETAVKDSYYDALPNKAQGGAGKVDAHAAVQRASGWTGIESISADSESRLMVSLEGERTLRVSQSGESSLQVAMYDVAGRMVAQAASDTEEVSIDTSRLMPGVYVLATPNGLTTRVIVK